MKKKLIVLLAAVVFLAAVTAALILVKKLTKEEEVSNGPTAVSQTAVKDIEGITYASESTKRQEVSLIREKDIWYYEKDKEFPLDQDYVTNTMVAAAAEAAANRTLDDPEADLSQYGLDDPAVTIRLKKITGDEVKMSIGSYNESVEGYYLKVDGDESIYLVDARLVFAFDMSIYEIADKEDYPLVEVDSFTHIAVEKDGKTVELKGEEEASGEYVVNNYYLKQEKTWWISRNGSVYKEGKQENIKALLSQLSSLDYSKMIAYRADEKEKEGYGLGKGALTLTVDYQVLDETTARQVEVADGITEMVCDTLDKQYVLHVGDPVPEDGFSDSEYYVCLEGSEAVYTINADSLADIINFNADNYEK